jgi:hypothetical protein
MKNTTKIPRILVCGGRQYGGDYYLSLAKTLDSICEDRKWTTEVEDQSKVFLPRVHIIAGGARGVDTLAVDWAACRYCSFTIFPADWETYGKSAGAIRNGRMITEGKPDLVVVFPGGKGTENMEKQAQKAGLEIIKATLTMRETHEK